MKNIGEKIGILRKKQNISQFELEQRTGIKREYISRLEQGRLKNPTLNTLTKLAQGLNASLEDLLQYQYSPQYSAQFKKQAEKIEKDIASLKKDLDELIHLIDLFGHKLIKE